MKYVPFILALALAATPASSAKPPPPTGTTTPDIGYVRISGGARRFYELRLANEDGTGANTIYSSRDIGQMFPHMGPRADRTIALVQGGRVSLVRYDVTSTGPIFVSIEPLFTIREASGGQAMDFSPNGKDIVWFDATAGALKIFNLDTRSSTPLLSLAREPNSFVFNRDGSAVLFLEYVTDTDAILKSVALAGGTPVDLGLRGNFWGLEAAHTSDGFIVNRGLDIKTTYLDYYASAGSGPTTLAQGYLPSFKCDDNVVIYQKVNTDGSVSLLRVNPTTLAGNTTSTKDNYRPDYVGC